MPSLETMPFFSVGYPNKERVEVTLLGPLGGAKANEDDWLKALVHVSVGGFKGEVEIYMCGSDMIRFKEQLKPVYEHLEGVAEFKTVEGQLAIKIEVDKLGHVLASGFILDDLAKTNGLNFSISYDQTLLWHTISEIDEALFELFPDGITMPGD